jgi:cell division cycle 2-like
VHKLGTVRQKIIERHSFRTNGLAIVASTLPDLDLTTKFNMASKPSKWATAEDDEETAAASARRKKEKDEKKRLREEKARNAAAVSAVTETTESPNKRQRTALEQENGSLAGESEHGETVEEGANILRVPNRQFGPCGHVDQFELLNDIEEGSYGVVSRARRKTSGTLVALKKLKMEQTGEGFPVTGLREIETLKTSRHANVVELQEVVMGDSLKE